VGLANLPEALLADAGVAVDGVHTLCGVLALVLQTVIVVLLTVLPHVAWQALTPAAHPTHTIKGPLYSHWPLEGSVEPEHSK